MIRIVTDTGSDITSQEGKSLGIEIVELDVKFDEFPYDYHNDLDFSVFYGNLTKTKSLPKTSQVNPAQYLEIFNDAKAKGDEVFVATLSGGLSGTHSSAMIALEECAYDGITVVDTRLVTISQRMITELAIKLRDEGKNRAEIEKTIVEISEKTGFSCCMDTLTYLKKGGRVPPAMAFIGNALKIKPVVTMKDGKAEPVDKVRGLQAGIKAMWNLLEKDSFDNEYPVYFGHTSNEERGRAFMEETKKKYNMNDCRLYTVGGVIGTHAGPNAIAISYVKK